jgi:MGT family glycosyltransferase
MKDLESRVLAGGLQFLAIGERDHPPGTLPAVLQRIGSLSGVDALRYTIAAAARSTEMFCRDLPGAARAAGVDAFLVDQTEPAGAAVADHLCLPYVTICNALVMNAEPGIPPPFTGWRFRPGMLPRLRNRLGYALSDLTVRPIARIVNEYRRRWKLQPYRSLACSFSRLAQISQQPPAFDYPRKENPPVLTYVGPLRDQQPDSEFPWDRLDGRPIVYASLGSMQGTKLEYFRLFAEACCQLPIQLVLSHGGALDPASVRNLPGTPLVLEYVPQVQLLAKATATLTHAGLNTVLDSLLHGVPMVTVPITYEQPAIARRVEWAGCGLVLSPSRFTARTARAALVQVLEKKRFRQRAEEMSLDIRRAGGVPRAADLIERINS